MFIGYIEGQFCSFEHLCRAFGIPRTWHFKYVQLRHATMAQFGGGGAVQLQNSKLEGVLLESDHVKMINDL